jgi:hypothetical protein
MCPSVLLHCVNLLRLSETLAQRAPTTPALYSWTLRLRHQRCLCPFLTARPYHVFLPFLSSAFTGVNELEYSHVRRCNDILSRVLLLQRQDGLRWTCGVCKARSIEAFMEAMFKSKMCIYSFPQII